MAVSAWSRSRGSSRGASSPSCRRARVWGSASDFGLIRFGSRVDVYLPAGARVLVGLGSRAIAGETVLADYRDGEAERHFKVG